MRFSGQTDLPFEPYFVVGAPRTGTTILHALICTDESVNDYIAECSYFTALLPPFALGWSNFDQHTYAYFPGGRPEFGRYHSQLLRAVLRDTWEQVGQPKKLALKDPVLSRQMGNLAQLLPESKYVVSIRDARDAIASRVTVMRKGKPDAVVSEQDVIRVCQEFNASYLPLLKAPDIFSGRALVVAYEGLSRSGNLAPIETFMGIACHAGRVWKSELLVSAERKQTLRYGENPHQQAAFYVTSDKRPGVATAQQLQGKELSYNNLNDTDAAFELVSEFSDKPTIAIIKHANPCGVAMADSLAAAWDAALRCDSTSAFGGIVAMNRKLDKATAEKIGAIFTEVIVAPEADEDAKAFLAAKKNLRLLITGGMADPVASGWFVKSVAGGYLVQTRDAGRIVEADLKVVTKRAPTPQELADMLFAFRVGKHVKSNTIVYAKNGATVGIGAGQMSRVDSARIAYRKAQDAAKAAGLTDALTKGSVAASDAFFPFADGLEVLVEAGATAVIQPGGSIRDQEVIDAADKAGLAMVFTGMRHFRH